MSNDKQRVVMVTGAAGNLGRAVAQAFARAGDRLVLVDLHADALGTAFGADGEDRLLVAADLLDRQQASDAAKAALDRFGRLDVLCHLAGGFRMGEAVHETSDETWDFLSDLNVRTFLNMARAVVPAMTGSGGKVVAVGAGAAQKGVAHMGAYCATKASVVRLVEAMSAELRERGINVNCVLPSIIDTPENRRAMPEADASRWVAPAALADAIAFLASDAARAIHGVALPVTGLV
jgi:NAD(P)-dependent dehydrogenase (short-subunit alcohol dehydrogenase family)